MWANNFSIMICSWISYDKFCFQVWENKKTLNNAMFLSIIDIQLIINVSILFQRYWHYIWLDRTICCILTKSSIIKVNKKFPNPSYYEMHFRHSVCLVLEWRFYGRYSCKYFVNNMPFMHGLSKTLLIKSQMNIETVQGNIVMSFNIVFWYPNSSLNRNDYVIRIFRI